jgi:hypothetical protein
VRLAATDHRSQTSGYTISVTTSSAITGPHISAYRRKSEGCLQICRAIAVITTPNEATLSQLGDR